MDWIKSSIRLPEKMDGIPYSRHVLGCGRSKTAPKNNWSLVVVMVLFDNDDNVKLDRKWVLAHGWDKDGELQEMEILCWKDLEKKPDRLEYDQTI